MEFVRVLNEESSLREKIFRTGRVEGDRVQLMIPYYNISAGWMDLDDVEECDLNDYIAEAGLQPVSSFAREPLHSQWAMLLWNVSRARDLQTAERIVEEHMPLLRR
jgi:hypothetical protein